MKSIKALVIAAGAVLCALPATAAEKLSYLSVMDSDALHYFRCAENIGATRQVLLSSNYNVFSSLPATFDKAGRAAVIKAALLAEEYEAKPKVKHISFVSAYATKLVASDIAAHRAAAKRGLNNGEYARGLEGLATCVSPKELDSARTMVDWLDNDVGLFKDLK
jgi:hypothetical protein